MASPILPYILIQHAYFFSNASTNTTNSTQIPCPEQLPPQTTPVPVPEPEVKECNIKYTPGIGTYKFHTEHKNWNDARRTCREEGGHLAIINSASEAQIVGQLVKEANVDTYWAYIGFHDLFEDGEFITVYDEPLSETGFLEWAPGEGTEGKACGGISPLGQFCDVTCEILWPFVCELPKSA